MNVSEAKKAEVTVEQLATLTGVTETWIRRLIKEGWIPAPEQHRVPLVAGVHGYFRFLKDPARRSQQSESGNRLLNARAELLEHRIAQTEERLMDINDVRSDCTDVLDIVEAEIAKVPERFSSDPIVQERLRFALARVIADGRARLERLMAELATPKSERRRH